MSAESVAGLILLVLAGGTGIVLLWVRRTANVLLDTGVPTIGTVVSVKEGASFDGTGPAWVTTIEYTDAHGETHRFRWGGAPITAETIQIVYDPAKPERASLRTPPNPRAERIGAQLLSVLIALSWTLALAGLLLFVGLLG